MATLRTLEVAFSFLADVRQHVDIAYRIIGETNQRIEKSDRLTLRASDFRSVLAVYNKDGIQEEIDDSVFSDIDVFIGFMHARFGRPLADTKFAAEHEYDRAINAHEKSGRPKYILFGFSDEPVRPSETDGAQIDLVKAFRSKIMGKQLCFFWETQEEFEKQFRQQLDKLVMRYKDDLNNYIPGGLRYK